MALFTTDRLTRRLENQLSKGGIVDQNLSAKAKRILNESFDDQKSIRSSQLIYDIFLSHSSSDATIVAGLKLELEDLGYSVYVDWINDPQLDRSQVTKKTATLLQKRMKSCKSLFYAFSENSAESRWMPWELGYFDGIKNKAAILPITNNSKDEFKGSEYLGIYYYITKELIQGSTTKESLWVNESKNVYVAYNDWISKNQLPYKHTTS